jgi:hypothetical protein
MALILRKYFNEDYTIGRFSIDAKYFCDTLEDKVRELHDINHDGDFDDPGEGKVYGRTAIPCGRYKVQVSYSPKLKRRLPLIMNVPGFSGIRIHHGKNANWTEGCPLVGENKIKGGLINGPYYETVLVQIIDNAVKEGKEVYITINQ